MGKKYVLTFPAASEGGMMTEDEIARLREEFEKRYKGQPAEAAPDKP